MRKKEITLGVARYVIDNVKTLKGMLRKEHYFNISGDEGFRTYKGFAVDVLAEVINNGLFFGEYIPASANQTCNCNNAKFVPINYSKSALVFAEGFTETAEGLLVKVPVIEPKEYTKILKSPENFKKYLKLVDLRSGFGERQKSSTQIKKSIDSLFAE